MNSYDYQVREYVAVFDFPRLSGTLWKNANTALSSTLSSCTTVQQHSLSIWAEAKCRDVQMLPGASHPNSRAYTLTIFLTGPRIQQRAGGKTVTPIGRTSSWLLCFGGRYIPRHFSSRLSCALNLSRHSLKMESWVLAVYVCAVTCYSFSRVQCNVGSQVQSLDSSQSEKGKRVQEKESLFL